MTQTELKQLLFYCDVTGHFTWLMSNSKKIKIGDMAGCLNKKDGYRYIKINGKLYLEHRLAWLYVHGVMPPDMVDHRNRIRDDNRIDNLRLATNAENQQNRDKPKNNTSGVTGVTWNKRSGKWLAQIMVNRKNIYLGIFVIKNSAISVRRDAEEKYQPMKHI